MKKRAFWCLAIDKTEDTEKVVVGATIILAEDQEKAKEKFLLGNAETLRPVMKSLEIVTSPFC